MGYGNFKDLFRIAASDKVIWAKTINVTKDLKYDEYQKDLTAMVQIFLIKCVLDLSQGCCYSCTVRDLNYAR